MLKFSESHDLSVHFSPTSLAVFLGIVEQNLIFLQKCFTNAYKPKLKSVIRWSDAAFCDRENLADEIKPRSSIRCIECCLRHIVWASVSHPCSLLKLSVDGDMGCVCLVSPSVMHNNGANPCLHWERSGRAGWFPERREGLQLHFLPALPVDITHQHFLRIKCGRLCLCNSYRRLASVPQC